jgi:GNAT superfamily N-acetyltransferase
MIALLVTYMEIASPAGAVPDLRRSDGASIAIERLGYDSYVEIYRRVGQSVQWDSRLRMPAADLSRLLADESTCIHVLRLDGCAAGFCEFCGVGGNEVELAHFGLDPAFYCRGLGSFLLASALSWCWTQKPSRIWLRTDTNDSPAAVHLYEKCGFTAYRQVVEKFEE